MVKEENIGNYISHESISATPLGTLVPATGRITKNCSSGRKMITFQPIEQVSFFSRSRNWELLGSKTLPQGIFGDVFLSY